MITHKRGSYFGYLIKASDANDLLSAQEPIPVLMRIAG